MAFDRLARPPRPGGFSEIASIWSDGSSIEDDLRGCCCQMFFTRTRFVVMILVLLCVTSVWASILSFNIVAVCINPHNHNGNNMTHEMENPHPDDLRITPKQETWAISSLAISALITNFIVVWLAGRIGVRSIFGILGIIASIATLLMPTAIKAGYAWLIVTRVVQGFSFAANFVVIGSFCARWTYYKQSGLFVSTLVAYTQLSPIFTSPVGGALCDTLGWESILYVHGGIQLFLFLIYLFFYRNHPKQHPFVGPAEKKKIAIEKYEVHALEIPYRRILKTPAIWGIWAAAIGNFFCVNLVFLYTPAYFSKALQFEVEKSGLSAAIPPFAELITKIVFGLVSDRLYCIRELWKFRIFNSIAFFGSGIIFLVLAVMGDSHKNMNSIIMAVGIGILGATTGGFFKAAPVISRQYNHFVTGYISVCNTLTMLAVPFIVERIAPNNTVGEWRIVFFVLAGVLGVTNIIFFVLIRGDPCEWTKAEEEEEPTKQIPGSMMF